MQVPNLITRKTDDAHRSEHRLDLIHLILLASIVLAAAILFLNPAPDIFPMDDSYIHQVYARNLALEGGLFFNIPEERGVGSTSLVWVLLLAGGLKVGLSGLILSKVIGALALFVVGASIYFLTQPVAGRRTALMAAILVILSGNMLWFTFSGMETTLFVAVALLALLAYRHQRWYECGFLLGLLPLIRPEGLALFLTFFTLELVRRRKIDRPIMIIAALGVLLSLPWFIYLIARTGHPIPTSGIGKQATTDLAIDHVLSRFPQFGFLRSFTPPVYILSWLAYLLEFALGGMSLPGPTLELGTVSGPLEYDYAWLALLLLLAMILPLLWPSLRRMASPARWRAWVADDNRRVLVIWIAWVGLHNLVFACMLPIPGTASRYGAINHVSLWWAVALGFYFLQNQRRWIRISWLAALILMMSSNVLYWDRVYQANQEHMQRVRIQAARYVDAQPGIESCAVFDIGALRSFSSINVIDIGGLIDPELQSYYQAGQLDHYLVDRGADCIIIPGRTETPQEGWLDILSISGLDTSSLFELSVLEVFEIEHDVWLLGYLPTNNYQESVVIYELIPAGN